MSAKAKLQKVINPATGAVIDSVTYAGKKEIEKTLQAARKAFDRGPWPGFSLPKRKTLLLKIARGILANAQELAQLETENTGKPIKETTFMDIPSSAQTFEYFSRNLDNYLQRKAIKLSTGGESYLEYEPLGVAVLIVPWNYPLLIASWKMAQALACGNTVILKPSCLTPLTAIKLGEIASQAGLPPAVVNVLVARGSDIGPALCADPRIDLISFTGSNETGKEIIRYAATQAKKMIMELGGKSASIICADADLDIAVRGALSSIFLNQGQMCTAMSRILVDKKIAPEFIAQFTQKAQKIKLGNGLEHETQMGPLISQAQRKNVLKFIEKGKREGARLLCGGKVPPDPALKPGFFLEPTVFCDVRPEMSIFQEEIFGPVACITTFSSEEEAITLANDSQYGLASSIWSSDIDKAQEISQKINAGTVWINTYGMFHNEAPYGGCKQSGFGKELGQEGCLEYCRIKHVHTNSPQEKPLVSYWYPF